MTADIAVLQALSKRIHFGKFIAEAKFQAETERYTKLILANDADGIMEALTDSTVEKVGWLSFQNVHRPVESLL